MSGSSAKGAEEAVSTNKYLAEQYYKIAIPALQQRMSSINQQLDAGEPGYLRQAYQGQRTGLTEGLSAAGGVAQAQQMAGSKAALSGGNAFASLHPIDVGTQLANALYGSKFQEGQANIDQTMNLYSMALGGAGTAGNAALGASGQELQAIGYLPKYNQTYANMAGGLAGGASLYGSLWNQGYFGGPNPSVIKPLGMGTSYTGLVGNAPS